LNSKARIRSVLALGIIALIAAGFGTRIFYVNYPRNAFDTHVIRPTRTLGC